MGNTMKRSMLIVLILAWGGAGPVRPAAAETVYRLSMLPRHAPEEIMQRIGPLARYLTQRTGVVIEPVVERDYGEYEKRLRSGNIDIGYENPSVYARVSDVHEAIAMAVDHIGGDRFRGLVIARSDGDIRALPDLKGRRVCIVGLTSTGGFLSPKLALSQQGLEVRRDYQVFEAVDNKQENVIFAVYAGEAAAGFIKESALHMTDDYIPAAKIRVLAQGAWLPNYALSLRRDLPEGLKAAIRQAISALGEGHAVLKAMKIKAFREALDAEYDPVRQALSGEAP